jgi:hypothetical protein
MINRPDLHPYAARLDREWNHLRWHRSRLAHVRSWDSGDDPFDRCVRTTTDLQQLVELARDGEGGPTRAAAAPANDALLRLVELANADELGGGLGDGLAGRIVLQRILPGLIAASARYRSHRDRIDPAEIAVASAWVAVHTDDTDRRPRPVAAALISDSVFQAFRRPLRRRSAGEEPVGRSAFFEEPRGHHGPSPLVELADTLREAGRQGVDPCHLELLRQLARADSPVQAARDRHISTRWLRHQRERAVAEVRRAVLAA